MNTKYFRILTKNTLNLLLVSTVCLNYSYSQEGPCPKTTLDNLKASSLSSSKITTTYCDDPAWEKSVVDPNGDKTNNYGNYVIRKGVPSAPPIAWTKPNNSGDVATIIKAAKEQEISVCARNGGHSYELFSICPGGIVIDLANLNTNTHNSDGTYTIGAGNTNWSTYNYMYEHGQNTIPGGSCGTVGISGLTLGGGLSLLQRYAGMTIDHLTGLTMVMADGRTITSAPDSDLLWASKGGGGGNFGIVTDLTFNAITMPGQTNYANLTWSQMSENSIQDLMKQFETCTGKDSSEDCAKNNYYLLAHLRSKDASAQMQLQILRITKTSEDEETALKEFNTVVTMFSKNSPQSTKTTYDSWDDVIKLFAWPMNKDGKILSHNVPYKATSKFVMNPIFTNTTDFASNLYSKITNTTEIDLQFDSFGGVDSQAAKATDTDTAFPWRDALYSIQLIKYTSEASYEQLQDLYDILGMFDNADRGTASYRNYADNCFGVNSEFTNTCTGTTLTDWAQRYYGDNLERLKGIKKTNDPDNFFKYPQSIPMS